jgi:hypothetical protein
MIWTIAIILLILWALGFGFNLGGNLIHTLLVIILVIVIAQLLF